jgi:hypothetical protein
VRDFQSVVGRSQPGEWQPQALHISVLHAAAAILELDCWYNQNLRIIG